MTKEILNKANALIEKHSEIEHIGSCAKRFSSVPLRRFSIDTNFGSISIDPDKYPELIASLLSRVLAFTAARSAELETAFAALQ